MKPTKNTGMVIVKTIPEGALVLLNGKKAGVTPFSDNTLLPNDYKITITLPRFEPYSETFDLAAGYTKIVAQNLVYKYGLITILSKPKGAEIHINDSMEGVTPYQNDTLNPGEYKLNLSLKGYEPINEKFRVRKHTRDTLVYTLFSSAKLDSVNAYKKEMKRGKRNVRRVAFGLFAAGAWGTGIYYESLVKKHETKAHDHYDTYKSLNPDETGPISKEVFAEHYEKAVAEQEKAKNKRIIRNSLYGTGGLFSFFFVLSIPF